MKKIISLWVIVALIATLTPNTIMKADTVSDVALAKECIDAIVKEAPTVDEYVFSEDLAEQIDCLERVLRDITSTTAMESLDAYVAEKTTVILEDEENEWGETEGSNEEEELVIFTYFTSVQEFSLAYSEAQKKALQKLAEPITAAIKQLLGEPLNRTNYTSAQKAYDAATKHIRDSVNAEDVNALNQIHELITLIDRADVAFSRIQIPTKNIDEDEFAFFMEDYVAAKTAYGLYDSKFASLKPKYYVCLQKDSKNALLENYGIFAKATYHANVEKAYDEIGVYDSFDSTVKEKMQALADAVEAGQTSEYQISVYDYYRGEDIHFILDQYKHMSELEEMMSLITDMPANKTELTAALRAYRYYTEDLTEAERDLVPEEYVKKLENAVLLNTSSEDVMAVIEEIGVATTEEEYEEYLNRYNKAYKAYRLFVNTYSGLSDIGSLITNVDTLDNATEVIEMIKCIRQIESTEDVLMCSKRLQMESVLDGYGRMDAVKKTAVFNIGNLRTIYEDATKANDLRIKVDVIIKNHSLLDEEYVTSIHKDYEALSSTSKRYFGSSYVSKIQSIDRDLEALNMNKALRVTSLINQIGTVLVTSKASIDSARNAYEELTEGQKTYVSNYETLTRAEQAFSQLELSVAKATVSGLGSYYYSGAPVKPAITVQLNGVTLTQDLDYQLTYTSNTKVGNAKVTISGIGAYTGTLTKSFTIRSCPIIGVDITGFSSKYVYTGKAIQPAVKASLNGRALKNGTDYVVSYKNNKNRGTATITVSGIGNYYGSSQAFFVINRNTVKNATVSGVKKSYVKTGKAIKPKVTVKVSGVTLKKNRDYKVTYKKNVKRGKATLTMKGKGNYSGTKKVTYKIV